MNRLNSAEATQAAKTGPHNLPPLQRPFTGSLQTNIDLAHTQQPQTQTNAASELPESQKSWRQRNQLPPEDALEAAADRVDKDQRHQGRLTAPQCTNLPSASGQHAYRHQPSAASEPAEFPSHRQAVHQGQLSQVMRPAGKPATQRPQLQQQQQQRPSRHARNAPHRPASNGRVQDGTSAQPDARRPIGSPSGGPVRGHGKAAVHRGQVRIPDRLLCHPLDTNRHVWKLKGTSSCTGSRREVSMWMWGQLDLFTGLPIKPCKGIIQSTSTA